MIEKQKYIELTIMLKKPCDINKELLIDELSQKGYDGFVDNEQYIQTYIVEKDFDEAILFGLRDYYASYTINTLEEQNWNKTWEDNYFQPIVLNDKAIIRAPFHEKKGSFEYELLIQPQMSFGSGHHETTRLIANELFNLKFDGKKLLDMGCGTGILAILSEKLGANDIFAIDNDQWAYENSGENIKLNVCKHINMALGDAALLPDLPTYDIILSNINLNINIENIPYYAKAAKKGSLLLLSGFYEQDIPQVMKLCSSLGYQWLKTEKLGEWVMLVFNYELLMSSV